MNQKNSIKKTNIFNEYFLSELRQNNQVDFDVHELIKETRVDNSIQN